MKKVLKLLFSRAGLVVIFMLLQIGAIIGMITYFRSEYAIFQYVFSFVSIIVIIYILNHDQNSAYKTGWMIPILVFPIWGIPLYFLFGKARLTPARRERMEEAKRLLADELKPFDGAEAELAQACAGAALQSEYIRSVTAMPVFTGTQTEFYPLGELMFEGMMEEMRKAERYIFLEFFIIAPGLMWDSVLELLEEKAAAGVDVRLIYDDMGCITRLPSNFNRQLQQKGIKCHVFHRFQPVLNGSFNNRNHRKIVAIDGKVAFTGGINLADEYINHIERFGHWLDCGVKIHGRAAYSLTLSFLHM